MLVHFPIALLIMYAVLELIRFRFVICQSYWFYVKAVLAICGTIGGYAALLTGDTARHLVLLNHPELRALIGQHEFWAQTSVLIFSVLGGAYILAWADQFEFVRKFPIIKQLWGTLSWLRRFILSTPVSILLALAGLVSLTITGALGGSIVYTPGNDPFTNWIYHLFIQ